MTRAVAPSRLRPRVLASFADPRRPAYCQVADAPWRGAAGVRTVHMYWIPEFEALGFNCHVRSRKWRGLSSRPRVSGCYYDASKRIQLRWEGDARLVRPGAREPAQRALLDRMWSSTRAEVRLAYWLDHLGLRLDASRVPAIDLRARCPSFATVLCLPGRWDAYELGRGEYRKGRRTLYTLSAGRWRGSTVSLLHGGDP